MMKKIGILALLVTLVASTTVASVMACTWTPGYWKNHPEAWGGPGGHTIQVGAISYDLTVQADKNSVMAILKTPVKGDAWINLAQKVIAMELSILDVPGTLMDTLLADSNACLAAHTSYKPHEPGRAEALAYAAELDYYLNLWDVH